MYLIISNLEATASEIQTHSLAACYKFMVRNISENFSYVEIPYFASKLQKSFTCTETWKNLTCLLYDIVINEKLLKRTLKKSVKIFYIVILKLFLSKAVIV